MLTEICLTKGRTCLHCGRRHRIFRTNGHQKWVVEVYKKGIDPYILRVCGLKLSCALALYEKFCDDGFRVAFYNERF